MVAAVWEDRLKGRPCLHCHSLEREEDMVVCDRCEACAHSECSTTPVHAGPWYCHRCRLHIITNGPEDVVEDLQLIEWLFQGKRPKDDLAAQ